MFKSLKQMPNLSGRYIVLDTETTGFDIKKDKLISISAVEVLDGIITGLQFNAYLKARSYYKDEDKRSKIVHYYMHDYCTESGIQEKQILKNFLNFVGNSIIVAHNAAFDQRFINHTLEINQLPIIPITQYRCTMRLAAIWVKELENRRVTLLELCEYFGIYCNKIDFHIGIFDAFMCARIFCKILHLIENNINYDCNNINSILEITSKESESNFKNITDISSTINKQDDTKKEINIEDQFLKLSLCDYKNINLKDDKNNNDNKNIKPQKYNYKTKIKKNVKQINEIYNKRIENVKINNKIPIKICENINFINEDTNIKDRMKSMLTSLFKI